MKNRKNRKRNKYSNIILFCDKYQFGVTKLIFIDHVPRSPSIDVRLHNNVTNLLDHEV